MSDLVTWLRARLDEDSDAADDVHADWCESHPDPDGASEVREHGPCDCGWPEFVRADVEAKRRILVLHDRSWENVRQHPEDMANKGAGLVMLWVVKLLGLPYAGEPGYHEEWRLADLPSDHAADADHR